MSANRKSVISGQIGEQLASAELLHRGHIVAAMPAGYPEIDLLVLNNQHQMTKLVQVKYTPGKKPKWKTKAMAERLVNENLIYILICTPGSAERFAFYCIPATEMASLVRDRNDKYVANRKRTKPDFVDNSMRAIELDEEQEKRYKDNFAVFGPAALASRQKTPKGQVSPKIR